MAVKEASRPTTRLRPMSRARPLRVYLKLAEGRYREYQRRAGG